MPAAPSTLMTPLSADCGVQFPHAADGRRSTTAFGQQVVAAALRSQDDLTASAALAERNWRQHYPQHFRALLCAMLSHRDAAIAVADAGLAEARRQMQWVDADGSRPLDTLIDDAPVSRFDTACVVGSGPAAPQPWSVPFAGRQLAGDSLLRQLDAWQRDGIIEPGCAQALERCVHHPEWFDLSDRHLVLLGAGSEAGPLPLLLGWRANVVAVDLPDEALWARLTAMARAGNGRLLAPQSTTAGHQRLGADLLQDTAAIARFLVELAQSQSLRGLDLAALAYLHGERHVRVVLAMDCIMDHVVRQLAGSTLMAMATPTDIFAVPVELAEAARNHQRRRPLIERALAPAIELISGHRAFVPNGLDRLRDGEGRGYALVDSMVLQQGPNYALAKRLQHWRMISEEARGTRVSINVAPSTTTRSVTRNPALKAAFSSASMFGVQSFAPETTNALMAALWVHDLRAAEARRYAEHHPLDRLWTAAAHGGLWRAPYCPRSVLPMAAALGYLGRRLGRG